MVQTLAVDMPRSEARRREILLAASRVFRRKGLHATGMRDIAGELGMHVGNLYYYFDGKQALLAYCQEETLTRLLELAAEVAALPLPADERLRRLIRGHVRTLNAEVPASLAHLEVEALEPLRRRGIVRRRRRYESFYRDLIEEGVSAGIFAEGDSKVASLAVLGAVNWTVKWFRPDGDRTLEEIGRSFADLMVGGLLDGGRSAVGGGGAGS